MARFDYVIKANIDGDAVATETSGSYQDATDQAGKMRVANPLADIVVIDTFRNEDKEVYTLSAPKVGTPATYGIGSDCYGYEVVSVSKSGRKITLKRAGSDGSHTVEATLRKDGRFRPVGADHGTYTIGVAHEYRDPSF